MKFVDTFAGIGGFHLAMKSVVPEAKCLVTIELNKECQQVYLQNHTTDLMLSDINKVDPASLPDHDILFGGFPCQPFSRASATHRLQSGILGADDRANLFFRLHDILISKQPKVFLFENVPGILTVKNADGSSFFSSVLSYLDSAGYNTFYSILSPHQFGVPQQRHRVFMVGFRKDLNINSFLFPLPTNVPCKLLDIMQAEVDIKYSATEQWAGRANQKLEGTRLDALERAYYARAHTYITPNEINLLATVTGDTPSGYARQRDKLYSCEGIAPTLDTFSGPLFTSPSGWRVLTPRECARLQSFPDTFQLHARDSVAYRQFGNAVNVHVVTLIINNIINALQDRLK